MFQKIINIAPTFIPDLRVHTRTDVCDAEKYITTAPSQLFFVTDVSRLLRLEFFNHHPNLHLKTVFDADQAMTPCPRQPYLKMEHF